jgi:hypothetical protein
MFSFTFFHFSCFFATKFVVFFPFSTCFFFSTTFATSFIFLVHLLDSIENTFLFLGLGFFCLVGFGFIAFLNFFWLFGSIENTVIHEGHGVREEAFLV